MALYLISYDIIDKDAFEYGPLWAKLRELGAKKILYSEWVVTASTGSAGMIYDSLAQLTTSQDRLLVQEILADAKWNKLLILDKDFEALIGRARR